MKFYIASKLENYKQVRHLAQLLKNAGWIHTYDWTLHELGKETDIETLQDIGQKEVNGVKEADIVIVFVPQGRGTHTELGMAIALNKCIYLCHDDDTYFKCDDNTSAFYWLSNVNHLIGNIEELATEIIKRQCQDTHI